MDQMQQLQITKYDNSVKERTITRFAVFWFSLDMKKKIMKAFWPIFEKISKKKKKHPKRKES